MCAMGERRTAHTVRSRKASPTSQLGEAQLERLIRESGDPARAATVADARSHEQVHNHEDLEAELELVIPTSQAIPVEPQPPRRFPDSSTVEDVVLLTRKRADGPDAVKASRSLPAIVVGDRYVQASQTARSRTWLWIRLLVALAITGAIVAKLLVG